MPLLPIILFLETTGLVAWLLSGLLGCFSSVALSKFSKHAVWFGLLSAIVAFPVGAWLLGELGVYTGAL